MLFTEYRIRVRCGCGRVAKYEVYDDHQPHCELCFEEAVSGKSQIPVRRLER